MTFTWLVLLLLLHCKTTVNVQLRATSSCYPDIFSWHEWYYLKLLLCSPDGTKEMREGEMKIEPNRESKKQTKTNSSQNC